MSNFQKLKNLCEGNKGFVELVPCGHDNVFRLHFWRKESVEAELTALGLQTRTQDPDTWIVGATTFDLEYYLKTWQPGRNRPKGWGRSDLLDFA